MLKSPLTDLFKMIGRFRPGLVVLILVVFVLPYCEKPAITVEPSPFEIYCDSLELAGVIDSWLFPILPGTPEYEALTPEQRDSVLQIPEAVLETMCTPGLIETCFNYPFLWHYMAWDHYSSWWNGLINSFNGAVSLMERKDATKKMLEQYLEYSEYPYSDTITWSSVKLDIGAKLVFTELFLSQQDGIEKLSSNEKYLLGRRAKHFWQLKIDNYSIEFSLHPGKSCFLMGRLMYYDNYGPFLAAVKANNDLGLFIKYGSDVFNYDESWEDILLHIDGYLGSLNNQ